ncbi:hypothetical protein D3C75_765260 [compost metagenome]
MDFGNVWLIEACPAFEILETLGKSSFDLLQRITSYQIIQLFLHRLFRLVSQQGVDGRTDVGEGPFRIIKDPDDVRSKIGDQPVFFLTCFQSKLRLFLFSDIYNKILNRRQPIPQNTDPVHLHQGLFPILLHNPVLLLAVILFVSQTVPVIVGREAPIFRANQLIERYKQ